MYNPDKASVRCCVVLPCDKTWRQSNNEPLCGLLANKQPTGVDGVYDKEVDPGVDPLRIVSVIGPVSPGR